MKYLLISTTKGIRVKPECTASVKYRSLCKKIIKTEKCDAFASTIKIFFLFKEDFKSNAVNHDNDKFTRLADLKRK